MYLLIERKDNSDKTSEGSDWARNIVSLCPVYDFCSIDGNTFVSGFD